MTPESASMVYDLGQHDLEITAMQSFLLTAHSKANDAGPELVELDRDEAYKLLITLQSVFHSITETE
jgi:hypothetical protein